MERQGPQVADRAAGAYLSLKWALPLRLARCYRLATISNDFRHLLTILIFYRIRTRVIG